MAFMENEKPNGKRVRRSREEIEELLAAFEGSGQTQEAFCRERGLSVATFSSWRRKRTAGGGGNSALRPVRLLGGARADAPTVRTPGGVEVALPAGTAVAEIAALVNAIEGGRPC